VTTDNNLNVAAPGYVTQSIALSGAGTPGTPTIIFSVANHAYGDAPFTVSASSNATGAFTYIVVSGPATISGSTVTLTGVGTVVLQASEAADTNYAVANHAYGNAPFTVGANSNSTGTFTYTVVSGPAMVAGSTVTLTGGGTVVLQASEAADANYTAALTNANLHGGRHRTDHHFRCAQPRLSAQPKHRICRVLDGWSAIRRAPGSTGML